MKFNVTMPFDDLATRDEFMNPEAVAKIAQTSERLGYFSAVVTDHPVPTGRWLEAGGHYAQDPFVMLSFIGAATKTLRLQTGIIVVPYRNPFIVARSVASLDVFSRGRVTLGMGVGYLKAEYKALGADFERRNDIMDEYLKAMIAAWTNDEFTFEGSGYQALGNRIQPRPVQQPHPPIYVGGNAKRAIRRAVELGQGWNPFFTIPQLAATSRTKELSSLEDLAESVAYMREYCEQAGRATPPDVIIGDPFTPGQKIGPSELVDRLGQCAALGVTIVGARVSGHTVSEWCDSAERYAEEVIAKVS
jgi:probable F420-dependent oxidoreductase